MRKVFISHSFSQQFFQLFGTLRLYRANIKPMVIFQILAIVEFLVQRLSFFLFNFLNLLKNVFFVFDSLLKLFFLIHLFFIRNILDLIGYFFENNFFLFQVIESKNLFFVHLLPSCLIHLLNLFCSLFSFNSILFSLGSFIGIESTFCLQSIDRFLDLIFCFNPFKQVILQIRLLLLLLILLIFYGFTKLSLFIKKFFSL